MRLGNQLLEDSAAQRGGRKPGRRIEKTFSDLFFEGGSM
jgi:hypothetical protein